MPFISLFFPYTLFVKKRARVSGRGARDSPSWGLEFRPPHWASSSPERTSDCGVCSFPLSDYRTVKEISSYVYRACVGRVTYSRSV